MSKHLKVGIVAVLSCLALLLGMSTSTGIASAHTQSSSNAQGDCCSFLNQPQITVLTRQVTAVNGCAGVLITGHDFLPSFSWNNGWHGENFARIFAFDRFGARFNVSPSLVLISHSGDFFTSLSICGPFRFFQTHKVFIDAQDATTGHTSNVAVFKLTNDASINPNA